MEENRRELEAYKTHQHIPVSGNHYRPDWLPMGRAWVCASGMLHKGSMCNCDLNILLIMARLKVSKHRPGKETFTARVVRKVTQALLGE